MSIFMIGIDHNKASVDVRALFSFTKKAAGEAMLAFKELDGIHGCVILSTCNRGGKWFGCKFADWGDSGRERLCK